MTAILDKLTEDGALPERCASAPFWQALAAAIAAKGRTYKPRGRRHGKPKAARNR